MYDWRRMTPEEREAALALRRAHHLPWHSPPHWDIEGERNYILSATCYEHTPIIGHSTERLADCEAALLAACREQSSQVHAWCVLPNHYHVLITTERIREMRHALGLFHGRSSRKWNLEDSQAGRKVWHNCFERPLKSQRHFCATLNYIHHNPVRHGYVERWQDWPFSSAKEYLDQVGLEQAEVIWKQYPILGYGEKWDI